jgi:hypothetical protein
MIHVKASRYLGADIPPSQLQRGLALLATISLFIGTRTNWTQALTAKPVVMIALSICYLFILLGAVLVLMVRSERALVLVEALILAIACVMVIGAVAIHHKPSDEGTLVAKAAQTMLEGKEIYGVAWPQTFIDQQIPITKMMDGGADYTFGYPPLAVLATAPALPIVGFPAAASVVDTLVLLIGALMLWILLPIGWRSGATAVMLGFPFLPSYARLGYPAIIAMVLLIPVVVRWPRIGATGRLRRTDVLKAVCLGAACAAQQLAWFVAPFLLIGLFALRRGEIPARRALGLVGAFAGIAVASWLVIDLPFIVADAPAWAAGVLLVLTQHAIPHGQGLIDISFYLTDGSRALDFYSYAALLLAMGLLVASVIWVRRLGPALTVIPWFVFYLSVRSQDGYFLMMTPLWLAAAATAPPAVFQRAWQPRLGAAARLRVGATRGGRSLLGPAGRVALAGLLLAPALACATIAVTSEAPLEMSIVAMTSHGPDDQGLWQMDVDVHNVASIALAPHFTISTGQSITPFWSATGGPALLAPHQNALYRLTAAIPAGYTPGPNGFFFLRALTDRPMTVSTTPIPIR